MSGPGTCCAELRPANSARPFPNPALGVVLACRSGVFECGQKILDFGAGCLRNSFFLLDELGSGVHAYDTAETVARFADGYRDLVCRGGRVHRRPPADGSFDGVVLTFVLETLCPCSGEREALLRTVHRCLRPGGVAVVSVRGRSDVTDNLNPVVTRHCVRSGGFVTSLKTFVRPYGRDEIRTLFAAAGFTEVTWLQDYRLESPRKFHLAAVRGPREETCGDGVTPEAAPLVSGLAELKGRPEQREQE